MELENSQNNALAKLPMLKLGEYEMWEIRIKQYFQIQDYALWEVIENGNLWVPIPVIAPESGPSTALSVLQKLVSRLAILGVVTPPEDLNVKFLRSLPSESKDILGAINDEKKLGILTTTANLMLMDLDEMDLKWNMALLSMRARKFYQRTGRKIIIDGSSNDGYLINQGRMFQLNIIGHLPGEMLSHQEMVLDLIRVTWQRKKYKQNMSSMASQTLRPTPLDLSYSGLQEFKQPEVNEYGPRDSSFKPTIGCDKESDNSKENIDDSLKQQQKTDSSSVKFPLKVDKDWKEKFFCPANHVREVEPKKARENNDAPIIEDWVSDDEDVLRLS
ncbi:hypothetical protein Tco_0597362 [Tanacetum coccineum]